MLCACASIGNPPLEVALQARSGSKVAGSIALRATPKGLQLRGSISGLKPNAEHAFHVHEKGDCSAPDAMSSGPHFNPAGAAHGRYGSGAAHHAGDMPNIRADASGVAKISLTIEGLTLGDANGADVRGRALVIHRDPDDYQSQPAGNAGPRIACAEIR
jgi:Cu-Zn family superoxide dismutase